MNQLKLIILFFSALIFQRLYSQEFCPIQNFSPDAYHGETQNWHICQSDKNLIYVANNKGLLEYNGAAWRLYSSPNHTIMRSVSVKDERIYTGCYMEFGYWEKDAFLNLKYTSLSQKIRNKLLDDEQFWNIICYQKWTLFQSLHRIYILDTQKNTFNIVSSKTNLPKIFAVGNQVFFQIMKEGVYRLENGKPLLISDNPIFKDYIIINIFSFGTKLLIQTQEKGFFIADGANVVPWQTESSAVINSLSVYSSMKISDGSYVLGTIGEGVYLLSPEGKIRLHIDKKSGLQNNTILSMFEDADHNIWLGLDNGISMLNFASPYRLLCDSEGIFGTIYAAGYHDGFLYLGTNQGLFYRALNSADRFQLVNGTKGQVWVLKVIDNTLFCGHNAGTFIVKGNKAELISNELGTWDIKPVENNPNLLIQGNYEGLFVLERSGDSWHKRNKIEGFDISSRYFELMPGNQIFVSHEYKGVYKLNVSPDYKKVTNYAKVPSAPVGSNSGLIKHNNQLLYFSESGMYEYDQKSLQFVKNQKLTEIILGNDSYVSGKMIEDDVKTLWVFTRNNLTAVSTGKFNSEPSVRQLALPLGIRGNVVGYENLLHLGNDIYLLGNTNGYILIDLGKLADKEHFIEIGSIQKGKSGAGQSFLALTDKKVHLKWKENNIKFNFYVTSFDKYTGTAYQYKLEGLDDDWSSWSADAEIAYRNLPSGNYTFMVRAKVGNTLTSNIASYHFSVGNPWYSSWWMVLLYGMILLLFLWLTNRLFRNRYEIKAEKINQEKLLMQLKSEKEIINLKNENLNNEIESINRELASTTMAVVKKNELLNNIKFKLQQGTSQSNVKSVLNIIEENSSESSDWLSFQEAFNNTDHNFLKKLKEMHPLLTPNDLKLCVYLRMNLSSKEIAPMLNISPQSVEIKRFRLRKKMGLSHEENLTDYILSI